MFASRAGAAYDFGMAAGKKAEKSILIVDDSRSVRNLFKAVLVDAGFRVLEANSGSEALELLKSELVDLVTLDVEISETVDNKVCLLVRDSGVGIPKDKLAAVFDSFTKAGRRGTEGEGSIGLGLSIVKDLVERHGSTVLVESEEGKGAIFSMSFDKVG